MNIKKKLESIVFNPENELTEEAVEILHAIIDKFSDETTRPIVVHKHTLGKIQKGKNLVGEPVVCTEDKIVIAVFKPYVKEFEANRDLFYRAGDLLQIAEMYFDSMKTRNEQGTIPFQVTSKILNELNNTE